MKRSIACIILSAGKSTRMKSSLPKVLHPICARPMLEYVIDLVKDLKVDKTVAVLGYKHEDVRAVLPKEIKVAIQKRLIGTADAVKEAMPLLKGFKGTILILYGDNPLLKKDTIKSLLKQHIENDFDATLLTALIGKPAGYGRILRDKYDSIYGIMEEKDANDVEKDIKEINTGIMCFNKDSLSYALKRIRPNNSKKEYYLTDAIDIIYKKGGLIDGVKVEDVNEALGINSRSELAVAYQIVQQRINEKLMKEGVTIVDPKTTFISYGTKIGLDSTIYPFTVIERNVKIGKRCAVGPFIRLRPGTVLENDVAVGNFLEIVRSRVREKTKARHFGYIGDTQIGKHVNIGAGTVTANFDGKKKNTTIIEDNVFIGSDTVLVAPVKVGKGAKTGAGSVVTKNRNIPRGAVAVGVPARLLKK
jgi:bifunctional UDP-N-acetylglucosamine pyrophosphorylase/glucosamine-1-phosphate N-acetyltransferase